MTAMYLIGIGLGALALAAALFNWDLLFVHPESQLIELMGGETAVRWAWGLGGLVMIAATVLYWAGVL